MGCQTVEDETLINEFIAFRILMDLDAARREDRNQKAILKACEALLAPLMMPSDILTHALCSRVTS